MRKTMLALAATTLLLGVASTATAAPKFPVPTCAPIPSTPTTNGSLITFSGYAACNLRNDTLTMRIHGFYSPISWNFSDARDFVASQKWTCSNCSRLPSSGKHFLQTASAGSGYYWTYIYITCAPCIPGSAARHSANYLYVP